ncbi:MAG: group 1 truncated hemoglobin [Gemmatimonadales bacterium]
MTTRAGLLAIAALCAGCGGTPEPQQTSPMTRPGPNAVAPVSPADRLRVGSATWSAPAPAEAPAAAPAPAEAPAASPKDTATPPPPTQAAPAVEAPAQPVPAAEAPAQSAPAAAPAQPSLYDRLGGAAAVAIVVDTFVTRVHNDSSVAPLFRGVDMDNFKRLMRELICQSAGGGCTYTGRSMLAAHQGLNVTDTQFDLVARYLAETLDQFNVPAAEKRELLGTLGAMRGDIVGH